MEENKHLDAKDEAYFSYSNAVTSSMKTAGKSKKPKKTARVFITTLTVMKAEPEACPKTTIRAFRCYFDAKAEHMANIQEVMGMIESEEEKQFFFNRHGKGSSNYIYFSDIVSGAKYVLTLTTTKVAHNTRLSTGQ